MTSLSLTGGVDDDIVAHIRSASSARVYDLLLDGVDNYQPDREAVSALGKTAKWIKTAASINRDFSLRFAGFSLGLGVRQFLDLGCGYPRSPRQDRVHEIAAGCPVVSVDNDPVVYAHAKTQLDQGPETTVIHADLLAMDQLLTCKAVRAAFDLNSPVAVHMGDVLPWCPDSVAVHRAAAILREWLPVGSILSITHLTDHWHPATMSDVVAVYAEHGLSVRPRSREEIADLFDGFIQQGPGLTATGRWHKQGQYAFHPEEHSAAFAGIAVKVSDSKSRPSRVQRRGRRCNGVLPFDDTGNVLPNETVISPYLMGAAGMEEAR
ncbi:DUF5999 family protein [Streptomyces sp. NPDC055025]